MRTRTRTDSPVEQRLDLSWDTPSADTPPVANTSPAEVQKPLDTSSGGSSEPVSPSPSQETLPASSNSTDTPLQTSSAPSESVGEDSASSTEEAVKQETTEANDRTDEPSSTDANAEPPAISMQDAPKNNSSTEPPSPALPTEDAGQPLPPPPDVDKQQAPPANTSPDTSTTTQDDSPEDASRKSVELSPVTPRVPRKPAPPVNIIPKDEPVGVVLARKREEANVKIEDLAKRLNINEFVIRYLETGDYEGLGRTFGENNCVYIIFNFKSIGEELGMSKNEIDDLVEKLNREIVSAGLKLDAPVKHDDDAKDLNSAARRRPVKSVLPKLIVITLVSICFLIIFLAVVVPYVNNRRPTKEKRIDYLPLIEQPWESMRTIPPQQLPIP